MSVDIRNPLCTNYEREYRNTNHRLFPENVQYKIILNELDFPDTYDVLCSTCNTCGKGTNASELALVCFRTLMRILNETPPPVFTGL